MTGGRRNTWRRSEGSILVGIVAWLLVGFACSADSKPVARVAADAPNLLVLMLDTASPRRMSSYGYALPTTPQLDAFAAKARLYERASSTSNWTLPSHASIFTGLYPTQHGAVGSEGWLGDEFETLAERLSAAGYSTYLFSANPFVSDRHNLAQGFETAEYTWGDTWRPRIETYMGARAYEGAVARSRFAPFKDAGPVIRDAFLAWEAQRDSKRPFFAFLNFMEAHRPWYVTRAERSRFLAGELLERSHAMDHSYFARFAFNFGLGSYDAGELAAVSGLYDASIRHLDDVLGDLFAELERRGRFEDTVVIVVSDHGDSTGEHGQVGHEYSLYDTLLRVPLIVRHERWFPPGREGAPVQSLDLYPTLLALAGLPEDPASGAAHSLLDLDPTRASDRPIVGEYLKPKTKPLDAVGKRHPALDREPWLRAIRSIQVGDYKLIARDGAQPELYHVADDPGEERNLASAQPDRVLVLRERLAAFDAGKRVAPRPLRPTPAVDDEHRQLLESIGYAEPSPAAE